MPALRRRGRVPPGFEPGLPGPGCGYPGPDLRAWSQPPPSSSGSGKVVGIVLGVVGGLVLLTVVMAAVVFVLVQNLSQGGPEGPDGSILRVTSAAVTPGQYGDADANLTCHTVRVLVDNGNGTSQFYLSCFCWSGQ